MTIQQPSLAKYRVPVFRELARRPGIDLTVVYGERSDLPNVPPDGFRGVAYPLRIRSMGLGPLYFHSPQWTYATAAKSDVLILTWNLRYLSLLPGLLRAKANRVSTILWGHGYSKSEKHAAFKARRAITSLAKALLFYNHTTARAFQDSGVASDKIFVALNSLDQSPIQFAREFWNAKPDELANFRERHEIESTPMVLYVSRLDPRNRVDLLIEAVATLRRDAKKVQVAIVGSGKATMAQLQDLAERLGVGKAVKFLGPIYDETELAAWFSSASVFCYPENIGLSILHAFGYGLPVVTSNHIQSHNPEIEALQDGVNGLLYRHGDVSHLAQRLWDLISNPSLRQQMSEAATSTVQKEFNLVRMVDGMESAIKSCCKP